MELHFVAGVLGSRMRIIGVEACCRVFSTLKFSALRALAANLRDGNLLDLSGFAAHACSMAVGGSIDRRFPVLLISKGKIVSHGYR